MNDVTQRKVLGFISLCRRAGRLTTGMDAAVEKAEKGKPIFSCWRRIFPPAAPRGSGKSCRISR